MRAALIAGELRPGEIYSEPALAARFDPRRRSRLYGLTALFDDGKLPASAEEHLEIFDALLARDEETVREVMTRHIGHIRDLWAQ
ncbi:FCD domain-containing protein [Streptomyces sp. VRA16 Mangrove soil]|nr:FCD domain-containing protein [Streptomyces sp. VRA16 Mangrove soil]